MRIGRIKIINKINNNSHSFQVSLARCLLAKLPPTNTFEHL